MEASRVRMLRLIACLLWIALSAQVGTVAAQEAFSVKANYTKYEYQIQMRDGVKLFTVVYVPKDASQKYPILLSRTPYSVGPYGPDAYKGAIGPSASFAREGYIFAYQDVRGRFMSEGEYMDVRPHNPKKKGSKDIDESSDTYDTIDWLIKNIPNNNGRVGMWGISYPGFYTAMGVIEAHPALKAASPQAPIADWFIGDDFHHNGTLFLPHAFNFYNGFGRKRKGGPTTSYPQGMAHGTNDGYKFFLEMGPIANSEKKYFKGEVNFWPELMEHGTYDEFWKARNTRPHLVNIKPAVMTVGGWFDAEDLFGALNTYKSIEKQNPVANNILVMGPWFHGGWARGDGESLGGVNFGSKTSEFYRENIELPFFNYYLKDKGSMKLPEAYVFETGTNKWKTYDHWPPAGSQTRDLYLHASGKLTFTAPATGEADYDEYISDPSKPVPFINVTNIGMTREYMTDDQRFATRRPDVLVFQTDVLTEDITVAGPITPSLFVSTSGTDSDYIVKVIDVFPDSGSGSMSGYQMLVRGEPMRAKFRNSFSNPEPMIPNKVDKVEFLMPDVNHTFQKGHRIMIQIQSTWFPLVDRNPQKYVDIYKATEADFQKATERVFHSAKFASRIKLNVLSNQQN